MADEPQENGADTPTENQNAPMLQVVRQYIKDMSFENPNAPETYRQGQKPPEVNINIEIGRQMLADDMVEVILMLRAEAKQDNIAAYLAEVEYAGLFILQNVSEQELLPLIMIECPRLLFPFARQIMATVTSEGGYPPIILDPPDFAGMFRNEMIRRAQEANATQDS